jgi:hypothetical protein
MQVVATVSHTLLAADPVKAADRVESEIFTSINARSGKILHNQPECQELFWRFVACQHAPLPLKLIL